MLLLMLFTTITIITNYITTINIVIVVIIAKLAPTGREDFDMDLSEVTRP